MYLIQVPADTAGVTPPNPRIVTFCCRLANVSSLPTLICDVTLIHVPLVLGTSTIQPVALDPVKQLLTASWIPAVVEPALNKSA